jgi:hypothetical protein
MKLTKNEHDILIHWIKTNFIPRATINHSIHSYNIQYLFEKVYDNGFYVDNDTIKDAMLECGFRTDNSRDVNRHFNVSQKSPAVQTRREHFSGDSKVRRL